ncbi:hypothetical protein [Litoreibacter roseus]|uniref:hypothetical protein n=1 Tax=Litoreibacter roseus TaxID=2601869 RepID=UPI00135B9A2D|nr:hypothetical protein [Litoreibacter roseus]
MKFKTVCTPSPHVLTAVALAFLVSGCATTYQTSTSGSSTFQRGSAEQRLLCSGADSAADLYARGCTN